MIVSWLLLSSTDHGHVFEVGVDAIENLEPEVDLALEEPVERVFDVFNCTAERSKFLGKVAGPR